MDLGLTGKKALVTGATKGIGRAVAETLLAEGASVSICARDAAGVDAAVSEMGANGTIYGAAVDAADTSALEAWVASSAEQLGGIDVYVHTTSGKPQKVLDDWLKNFEIDLKSLVAGVAAAADALADGGGAIVSIGTTATAEHFASGSGSYTAFKAAVTNWTLGQAQVLGARGSVATSSHRGRPGSTEATGIGSPKPCPISSRRCKKATRPGNSAPFRT